MGGQGRLDELVPGAGAGWWAIRACADRQFRGQGPSLGGGRKRGEKNQAIGRSRGGRTTKIHALTDALCRPLAFMLTGGQVADCTAANPIRRQVEDHGALPNIPPKANRKWKPCFSPFLYRNRNAIERMFCRLKDFRRVATRYDRSATNFLAAVSVAATVSYWL